MIAISIGRRSSSCCCCWRKLWCNTGTTVNTTDPLLIANVGIVKPSSLLSRQQQQQQQSRRRYSSSSSAAAAAALRRMELPKPFIIYQSNHLLVLYKPPGWHSIPNNTSNDTNSNSKINSTDTRQTRQKKRMNNTTGTTSTPNDTQPPPPPPHVASLEQQQQQQNVSNIKCLLSYCQNRQWGGGSQHNYIKPMHRIDQPCSGILLYSKTTKAASRIQSTMMNISKSNSSSSGITGGTASTTEQQQPQNNKSPIRKVYYVMVHINDDDNNRNMRHDSTISQWMTLHGIMLTNGAGNAAAIPFQPPQHDTNRRNNRVSNSSNNNKSKGWSVRMVQPTTEQLQKHQYSRSNNNDDDNTKSAIIAKEETTKQQRRLSPKQDRICTLQYRIVNTYDHQNNEYGNNNTDLRLLQVVTQQGTRHMIRALLSCYRMHVVGDVRYSSSSLRSTSWPNQIEPLPDQSVALHAYSITMKKSVLDKTKPKKKVTTPTINVTNNKTDLYDFPPDNTNNKNDKVTSDSRCTGSTGSTGLQTQSVESLNAPSDDDDNNDDYYYWKASIPQTWSKYFQCTQLTIDAWEQQYPIWKCAYSRQYLLPEKQ